MINDQKWRLNNLYRVVNKKSNSVPFRLNKIQEEVYDNMHNRNLILKARQLGMSTFAVIYMVDCVLFTPNLSAGIVSYSLEHAQHIFKKIIGHALDTLPQEIKEYAGILQRSAREISFNNGSSLRVDTTLRGGSYPLVLVSEFGKTCARNPGKAEEVITGTLQAVDVDGRVIIESTGEGNEGYFAEMVLDASQRKGEITSPLQYKLFFYPWYQEKDYAIDSMVNIDPSLTDYFAFVEKECEIQLTWSQKYWYATQKEILGDKIKQEYPSTISEAFLASTDAYYFADQITKAYGENRVLYSPLYDAILPVYVAMDIGVNDLTVIIFFQLAHGEIRIIDYYEDSNKGVDFYAKFLLQDKPYLYNTIFLPHDSTKRDPLDTSNTYERDFRRLFSATATKFHVLPKMDLQLSISNSKMKLSRCVFNASRVKPLIDRLVKYRKKWSEPQGRYLESPQEGINEHYADAFRYVSQAVSHLEVVTGKEGALQKHRQAVESRYKKF